MDDVDIFASSILETIHNRSNHSSLQEKVGRIISFQRGIVLYSSVTKQLELSSGPTSYKTLDIP